MGKHLTGNPNIIVQNMPGAGSIIATNYVSNVVKPDGLTLGMIGSGIYLDQLLGVKEALYDVRKMPFIGSVDQRDLLLYMRADAPWNPQPKEFCSRAKTPRAQRVSFRPLRQAQDKLREKSFLDPSHPLGMTGGGPSLGALCAFARVIRCGRGLGAD